MTPVKYIFLALLISLGSLNATTEELPDIGGKFGVLENLEVVEPPIEIDDEQLELQSTRQLNAVNCYTNIWVLGHLKVRYYAFSIKARTKTWAKYGSATSACGGYYNAKKIGSQILSGNNEKKWLIKSGELSNASYIKVVKKPRSSGWGDYIYGYHYLVTKGGKTIATTIKLKNNKSEFSHTFKF